MSVEDWQYYINLSETGYITLFYNQVCIIDCQYNINFFPGMYQTENDVFPEVNNNIFLAVYQRDNNIFLVLYCV